MKRDLANTTHYVYVYRGANGQLLYVGCTSNPQYRDRSHRSTQPWYPHALPMEIVGTFPTLESGRAAEADYINGNMPIHNVASNRDTLRQLHRLGEPQELGTYIANLFREAMELQAVGPVALSKATNIPKPLLIRLLSGGGTFNVTQVHDIAQELNLPLRHLYRAAAAHRAAAEAAA